ncbi:MAG: pyridoxamine kinase [Clostridia bacterium]|nr:pyridoxamine kinase [Oscillospiraceae bacterium]MBR6694052.1 pyridoxamine kinase [Clostridia bacterium]
MQKRVAAIHDISGFGKCSLTVALPIISAAGVETAVIPTAVLSTHTGGFKDFTFRDLTEDIVPIAKHWKAEGIRFDAIYTGYLGSFRQIDLVCEIIDILRDEETVVVVDPVMADHGKLYQIFPADFPQGMKKLCAKADIVIPNLTEACLMLGIEYKEGVFTEEYVAEILTGLKNMGAKLPILTGVYFDDKKLGAAALENGMIKYAFADRVDAMYHGTGDVYGSALIGALMNGKNIKESMQIAAEYTSGCIRRTKDFQPERTYGVDFENELPKYIKLLGK